MTVIRGFLITLASGFAGGVMGLGIGFLLGRFAPDYYRVMFRMPIDLDPTQAGIGLGLTQGLGAGLMVGLVIVLTVAWYESRIVAKNTEA